MKRTILLIVLASFTASNAYALNPQPLPPKTKIFQFIKKGTYSSLNPQPLPPRYRLAR